MLEVLQQDFIRTATAKGLARFRVIFVHALRNAMIPVVTMIGLQFGGLMAGAVLTETIFAWPGIGRLVVEAINNKDFPLGRVPLDLCARLCSGKFDCRRPLCVLGSTPAGTV